MIEGKEVFFDDAYILSETDEKGIITFASESFCKIAGYEADELIGAAHNIVRHPEMPRAAFRLLWDDIQAKGFWSGIVKNRCRNGDYYWVVATVLRKIDSRGNITYCSIRTKPSRDQVEQAEALYKTLE